MKIIRPCLACGHENAADAGACGRCGAPLVSSAASAPSIGRTGPSPRRIGAIAGFAALALGAGASAWWFLSKGGDEPVRPALEWREPKAVAAWAKGVLEREGAPPEEVSARVVPQDMDARRVFVTSHPDAQPLSSVALAAAKLLLAARAQGPSSAAHLAVIRGSGRTLVLPVGEAASIASNRAELARWLGIDEHDIEAPPERAESGAPLTTSVPPSPAASTSPEASAAAPAPSAPAASSPATAVGPPARIARGNGAMATKSQPGQASVPVLRVQVAAGARRTVHLRSLTVKASGTLDDLGDVAWVDLWREAEATGKPGVKAERVGDRQSFGDDDGRATFGGLDIPFGADGLPLPLLVSVDLADESEGGTLEVSVADAASVTITDEDGQPVAVTGAPVTGSRDTIEGNVEPDPEQQRLDALAGQGPDAVDPNVERMRAEAMEKLRAAKASAPAPAQKTRPQSMGATPRKP